jgi:4-hydroxybenzoate polyprenyltransferase
MVRCGDWWRLLRASNLPTVWTNVLVGVLLALPASTAMGNTSVLALLLVAGSAAYLGGMVLNDLSDLQWDRSNNTSRPLVKGAITPRAAAICMATLLIGSGMVIEVASRLSGASPLWSTVLWAALLGAIVLYNEIHRRDWRMAAITMGLCRGLLVLLAAFVTSGAITPMVGIAATGIALWTAGITVLARGERGGESTIRGGLWLLLVAALSPLGVFVLAGDTPSGPLVGGLLVLYAAWIPAVWRHRGAGHRMNAVVWAICGLCVLDAALLLAVNRLEAAGLAMVCLGVCWFAQRRASGT